MVQVALPGRRAVALFPVRGVVDDALVARMAEVVRARGRGALALVVVGGDAAHARAAWKLVVPRLRLPGAIERFHVDVATGVVSSKGRAPTSPTARALRDVARRRPGPGTSWPTFVASLAPIEEQRRATAASMKAFHQRLARGSPWATGALLVAVVAGFLLELALGATSSIPLLSRMGANAAGRVEQGEGWRVLSSIFLHGSWLHALLNGYVLFHLGHFVERLLGTARFLVLFAIAGAAGGALSALAGTAPVSVGASGALWGLLGAAAALAFRPQGLVPDVVQHGLKRAAFVNLGLNLAISFLPNIDVLAHVGGGLAGALLVGGGALVVGLKEPRPAVDAAFRFLAVVAGLALVGSVVLALGLGRPWALKAPPEVHRATAAGLSFETPKLLGPPEVVARPDGGPVARVGDVLVDPVAFSIARFDAPAGLDEEAAWRAVYGESATVRVPDARPLAPWAEIDLDGRRAARATWERADGLVYERVVALVGAHVVVVEAVRWPDGFDAWEGVARSAAGGAIVVEEP